MTKRILTALLILIVLTAGKPGERSRTNLPGGDWEGQIDTLAPTLWMDATTAPTEEGPIRHYRLNDNAASTTITDLTGNGNATLNVNTNTLSTAAGKISRAIDFDGDTSRIDTGSDIISTGARSICFWHYPQGNGDSTNHKFANNGSLNYYWTHTTGAVGFSRDGATAATTTVTYTTDTWYHFCVSSTAANPSVCNIYLNGILSGSANQNCGAPTAGTANVFIGSNAAAATASIDGYLDDYKVWDYAISSKQVADEYHFGSPRESEGTVYSGNNLVYDDGGSLVYAWQNRKNGSTIAFRNSTDASKPVRLLETGQNRYAVDFVSSDLLQTATTVGDLITSTAWTAFVAYSTDNLVADGPLISEDTANTWTLQLNSDEDLQVYSGTGSVTVASTPGLHLASAVYDHTAIGASIDGGAVTWGAGTAATTTNVVDLGTDGTDFYDGRIREILVFNKVLSPDQIKIIQRYLIQKHGITATGLSDFDRCPQFFASKTPTMWLDSSVVEEGPIRHFKLEDNAANTTVVDSVGNANGTLNVNTSGITAAAKISNGFDFYKGSAAHYIDLGGNVIAASGAFTFCAWYKDDGHGGSDYGRWYASVNGADRFTSNGTTGGVTFLGVNSSTTDYFTHDGSYRHICGVRSSNTAGALYLNGALKENITHAVSGATIGFIGANSDGAGYFDGILDDIRIYDYALTAQQVSNLYNAGTGHQYEGSWGPSTTQAGGVVTDDGGSLVLAWEGKLNASAVEFSQTTDANKPTYSSSTGVYCDQTNDIMTSTTALSTIVANNAKTVIAALAPSTTAAGSRYVITDSNLRWSLESNNGPYIAHFNYDANADYANSANVTADTTHIYTGTHNGTNVIIQKDNDASVSTASGNTGAVNGTLRLCAYDSNSYAFKGYIKEIITDDSVWSAADLATARMCLGRKWGVSF